jgi:hypothetical protein
MVYIMILDADHPDRNAERVCTHKFTLAIGLAIRDSQPASDPTICPSRSSTVSESVGIGFTGVLSN